jgi:hypothetical protein
MPTTATSNIQEWQLVYQNLATAYQKAGIPFMGLEEWLSYMNQGFDLSTLQGVYEAKLTTGVTPEESLPEGIPGMGDAPGTLEGLEDAYTGPTEMGLGDPGAFDLAAYFGGGEGGQPYAGWLRKLQGAGMLGGSPAQQWMKNQYQRAFSNWLMQSSMGFQGQGEANPIPTWYESRIGPQQQLGQWGQFGNYLQGLGQEDIVGQYYAGEQGAGQMSQMALGAARAQGLPGPIASYAGGQMTDQYNKYLAFGQQGLPDTSGMSFYDWLSRQYRM